jgi:hypothetical protein
MSQKFLISVPLVVNGGDGKPSTLTMIVSIPREREATFGEELIVYADEQGTSNPNGGTDFAVGLEFGSTPIPNALIQEALDRRKCDILIHRRCRDKRTHMRRDFFHATDDCEECRSILTEAIRDKLHERFFLSLRWHFPYAKPDHPEGAELHQHAIAILLGLVASHASVRRIVFKFERVQGMFAHAISKWLTEDIDIRIKVMLRHGLLLHFVPVDVQEVGKNEHGIQVCDHLLWRENRQFIGKPERIEDAGMIFQQSQDHPPYKITLYQHGDVTLPHSDTLPEPRDPGDIPWQAVVNMLYNIEVSVHNLAQTKPADLHHLNHTLKEASDRARGKPRISFEDFTQLANAFLTVVGLYIRQPEVPHEHLQVISDMFRLSVIIGQQRETRAISMFNAWQEIRGRMVEGGDLHLV